MAYSYYRHGSCQDPSCRLGFGAVMKNLNKLMLISICCSMKHIYAEIGRKPAWMNVKAIWGYVMRHSAKRIHNLENTSQSIHDPFTVTSHQ